MANHDGSFADMCRRATEVRELYEQFERQEYGRAWSTEELGLGFVGDVGDLAKLLQADAGVRAIEDHRDKLAHELADCLWSVLILAERCDVDLEQSFDRAMKELKQNVSAKLVR